MLICPKCKWKNAPQNKRFFIKTDKGNLICQNCAHITKTTKTERDNSDDDTITD